MTVGSDALKQLDGPRVETRTAQRRSLAIGSWDDLTREIDRIERASRPDGEGLRVTGNWSVGQIFDHLARTIERSIDGFSAAPASARNPPSGLAGLGARAVLARAAADEGERKSRLLTVPMPPDAPSVALPGELEPPAQVWTNDAAARLVAVVQRVRAGHAMDKPSPTLGRMTRDEWETYHFRHAALHLSFIVIGEWR